MMKTTARPSFQLLKFPPRPPVAPRRASALLDKLETIEKLRPRSVRVLEKVVDKMLERMFAEEGGA